jgi:CRP/FNR family transcriptional regulator, anaerobic regulatory protein
MEDLTPSLRAIRGFAPGDASAKPILTETQRKQLAALATRVEVRPRVTVYREGAPAEHLFVIGSGLVKTFRDLPSGRRRIVAFWYPGDIFGLAERGKYAYTVHAVTASTLYRIPRAPLKELLLRDGHLQFQFLIKVTHEFRQAQHQKIALMRRDAVGKVATFFSMLEQQARDTAVGDDIAVPMSRSDIANFLGLSPEAVSRATRELVRRRLVAIPDLHSVRILDRARFALLVSKI